MKKILIVMMFVVLPIIGFAQETIKIQGYEFEVNGAGEMAIEVNVIDGNKHNPNPYNFKWQHKYIRHNITEEEYFNIIQKMMTDMGDKKIGILIKRWNMGVGNVPIQHKHIAFQYVKEKFTMYIYIL